MCIKIEQIIGPGFFNKGISSGFPNAMKHIFYAFTGWGQDPLNWRKEQLVETVMLE
jgi:hypothetical protein